MMFHHWELMYIVLRIPTIIIILDTYNTTLHKSLANVHILVFIYMCMCNSADTDVFVQSIHVLLFILVQ